MSNRDHIKYFEVETKPRNKAEYDQLGGGFRVDDIVQSTDGTKFVLQWDSKERPRRPTFLNEATTKTFTRREMRTHMTKDGSDYR